MFMVIIKQNKNVDCSGIFVLVSHKLKKVFFYKLSVCSARKTTQFISTKFINITTALFQLRRTRRGFKTFRKSIPFLPKISYKSVFIFIN